MSETDGVLSYLRNSRLAVRDDVLRLERVINANYMHLLHQLQQMDERMRIIEQHLGIPSPTPVLEPDPELLEKLAGLMNRINSTAVHLSPANSAIAAQLAEMAAEAPPTTPVPSPELFGLKPEDPAALTTETPATNKPIDPSRTFV